MGQLHILFLPLMAHGHMIPILEMAKLFTSRGLKTTIISTPSFAEPVEKARESGMDIGLIITDFPPEGSGLPNHIVSVDQVTDELFPKFVKALSLLQEPVERIIEELNPNAFISDMFLPWTVDSAAKFNIPRLVFHGTSYFALCVSEKIKQYKPFKNVSSDSEPFTVPNLPHELTYVRTQLAVFEIDEEENDLNKLMREMRKSDIRSYGVVVNSFYELEPDYADYYRNVLGRKAWNIGPLLLYSKDKGERGRKTTMDEKDCIAWLDSKKPNSVVYVCFGSMAHFSPAQLHEIATGLESSGQYFIWVVRKGEDEEEIQEWLPKGFLERTNDRGLFIRGWAPQVAILNHPAVGAFVTHCGWNSTLEGICAGVPMVTWPLFAEQFHNEKLVTKVLGTGVHVGSKKWQRIENDGIAGEALAKAVEIVMVGEPASEMRRKAKEYREMAKRAVGEGGSSYCDLSALIEDLSGYKATKCKQNDAS